MGNPVEFKYNFTQQHVGNRVAKCRYLCNILGNSDKKTLQILGEVFAAVAAVHVGNPAAIN